MTDHFNNKSYRFTTPQDGAQKVKELLTDKH